MASRTWTYAVTFEAPESKAPETLRGTVCAGSAAPAVARAYREAARRRVGRTWDSVLVLIEKGRDGAAPKVEG